MGEAKRRAEQAEVRESITAAHNNIYDAHNPLRVRLAIEVLNTEVPETNEADLMVVAANLLAQVFAKRAPMERTALAAGVLSMALGMAANEAVGAAGSA